MKKQVNERWLDKKRYVTDDWGSTEETTNRVWLKYHIFPSILMGLILIGMTAVIIFTCKYADEHKTKYGAAVIIGEPSIVVHIDHYKCNGDRYTLYDKDGYVYSADKSKVVFYNYDKEN